MWQCAQILFLSLCLWGVGNDLWAQSVDLPTLHRELAALPDGPKKVRQLIRIGKHYHYYEAMTDSSLYYCEAAIDLGAQLKDFKGQGLALSIVGQVLHTTGNITGGKQYLLRSLAIAQVHPLDDLLPKLYNDLGMSYFRLGMPDSSLYYLGKAEEIFLKVDKNYLLWKTYHLFHKLYLDQKEYEKAMLYGEKAFEIVMAHNNRVDQGYCIFQLAYAYFLIGDIENYTDKVEQWYYFKGAMEDKVEEDARHLAFGFLDGEPEQVIKKLEQAALYGLAKDNLMLAGMQFQNLGHYLTTIDNYADAVPAFINAHNCIAASGMRWKTLTVKKQLYETYQALGQKDSALIWLERYTLSKDSLQSIAKAKDFAELEIKYETEKKDLVIGQRTRERNFLLIGSTILIGFAVWIIMLLRYRLRTNRRLAQQTAEIQAQQLQRIEQEQQILTYNAMIEGQESERHRIAKDLHDTVGGMMSAVKAHFSVLFKKQAQPDEAIYHKTQDLIDEACEEVRRISHNMIPRALELSGLEATLQDLTQSLRLAGVAVTLECRDLDPQLHSHQSAMIYRILQELLNNITRHAQATEVFIQLLQRDEAIYLQVEDNGKGFDSTALRSDGMGLSSVKSRVDFLRGELHVDSAPGQGTSISIRIPVQSLTKPVQS